MARNESSTPAADATPATDERFKLVKDPETGLEVKRKDFILKCWTEKKMARGQIAKLLTEITGKPVKYQIVFAATKKIAGGPAPETAAASTETAAA